MNRGFPEFSLSMTAVALVAALALGAPAGHAEDDIAAAMVSATEVSATEVSATEVDSPTVVDLTATLMAPWPDSGTVPAMPLLGYTGVADAARHLLGDKYPTWLGYLGAQPEVTLAANGDLLQSIGCTETCDMHKALLIVSPDRQKAYVAMVDEGHVIMRPSLMTWPDEAIAPLKAWLASNDFDK